MSGFDLSDLTAHYLAGELAHIISRAELSNEYFACPYRYEAEQDIAEVRVTAKLGGASRRFRLTIQEEELP